jgi:putative thioredoxin
VESVAELAMNLQLQEIPTVFAIHEKKVVNKIQGNLNDTEIAGFVANCAHLAKLASGEGMLEQASELLSTGEIQEALTIYGTILHKPQDHSEVVRASAMAGMAMCALALDDLAGAKEVVAALRENHKLLLEDGAVKQALTAVDMAVAAGECGDEAELEAALAADANDHATRNKLAILLFSKGEAQAAMNHALEIMKRDRAWDDDGGRKLLLKFFESLGSQHPDVIAARKRLSALLFV